MLKPTLQLRLGQQLTMTPQLQQAIRLLQLPALDLQAHIREALESNVMLESLDESPETATGTFEGTPTDAAAQPTAEVREPQSTAEVEIADDAWAEQSTGPSETPWSGDVDRAQEFSDQRGQTLQEHLAWQLELARLEPRDQAIGRAIVDAINDDGYLRDGLDEIRQSLLPELSVELPEIERVLGQVQSLDPAGVGARSIGECITLQLAQLDPQTPGLDLALRIAERHLDEVAAQQYSLLKRQLRVSDEELENALALVRSCHPRPGSAIHAGTAEYVVPDVFVRRTDSGWSVEINPATLPRIRVNQSYAGMLGRSADHANLRAQLQEARWLLRSLEIRNDTLLKVARCIVQRQSAFFDQGDEGMQPMILRDVAEAVEMHESTISRVTTAKYMHTPRGVYEFRHFFSSHVAGEDGTETSSTAIRAKIRKLIAQEDPTSPLSDSKIAELLSQEGIPVARRTVAKYREAMQLAPSNERKRANGAR
ncbi:MAG TPA: RNA polymerase factor sigma-54 [Steroidobacteraceae bacterium]|jgi:RNA polymerase sigma-54 factor|nr:RNA polymerase factor sigma-54 [Steroidobacteraceae bacterium]